MSFVTADHVMSLTEQLVVNALGKTVPHMKIPDPPFPRMPYMVAMEKVRGIIIGQSLDTQTTFEQ